MKKIGDCSTLSHQKILMILFYDFGITWSVSDFLVLLSNGISVGRRASFCTINFITECFYATFILNSKGE